MENYSLIFRKGHWTLLKGDNVEAVYRNKPKIEALVLTHKALEPASCILSVFLGSGKLSEVIHFPRSGPTTEPLTVQKYRHRAYIAPPEAHQVKPQYPP